MRYEINVLVGQKTSAVALSVFDDADTLILEGNTEVCTTDEPISMQYAESIFLPDLCCNFQDVFPYSKCVFAEGAITEYIPEVVEDVPPVEEIPEA